MRVKKSVTLDPVLVLQIEKLKEQTGRTFSQELEKLVEKGIRNA